MACLPLARLGRWRRGWIHVTRFVCIRFVNNRRGLLVIQVWLCRLRGAKGSIGSFLQRTGFVSLNRGRKGECSPS